MNHPSNGTFGSQLKDPLFLHRTFQITWGNNIGDLNHDVQVVSEETLVGGGLHVATNSPSNGVNSLKGSIACDIELQNTVVNHPCNVKIDNLRLGQGGEQAMRIQDPIEFLAVNVDERQPLKAIYTNVRNVVMKDKKTRSMGFDKVSIHTRGCVKGGDP
jgi:hypothetical protein